MDSCLQVLLPVASAFLHWAAFPPLDFAWLAWIALVPLGLLTSKRQVSLEGYLGAYLAGLLFHLLHLDWLRTAYRGEGLAGPEAMRWFGQGLYLGVYWLIAFVVARLICHRYRVTMVVALPVAWSIAEWLRREGTALFVDQTGYPWGQLGFSQIVYPRIAQLADLGGVSLITFLVALVNGVFVDLCVSARGRIGSSFAKHAVSRILVATLALVTVLLYGGHRIASTRPLPGPTVALMPKWPIPSRASPDNPLADILLWTELVTLDEINTTNPPILAMRSASGDHQSRKSVDLKHADTIPELIPAVASELRRLNAKVGVIGCQHLVLSPDSRHRHNAAACVSAAGDLLACYDKIRLVPWTEFTPSTLFRFFIGGNDRFRSGTEAPLAEIETDRLWTIGPTICYDCCFADVYRRFRRGNDGAGPSFFVQIGGEGHDRTRVLQTLMLRQTQFRAIETRRSIARHVSFGYSCIIDSCGQVESAPVFTKPSSPIITLGSIPVDSRWSAYALMGDWVPILCVVVASLILLRRATKWETGKVQLDAP